MNLPLSSSSRTSSVIVRLPNWVGDVCMALPSIIALRNAGLHPTLVGKGWIRDLLAGCELPLTPLPKGIFAAAKTLRQLGIQDGLLLTNSFGSALAMRLAGVRALGYRHECRSFLLGHALTKKSGAHEAEVFWTLTQALLQQRHISPSHLSPPPAQLPLHPRHLQEAQTALDKASITGPYTVLCPLATGTVKGRSKVWPAFPLLSRMLSEQGETVIACPGPGEEAACAAALPGITPLAGLGLGSYAAIMASSQRVIANDSGPMHIAAAVGAPVLGIFGVTDPQRTRPWAPHAQIIGSADGFPSIQDVWTALAQLKPRSPA